MGMMGDRESGSFEDLKEPEIKVNSEECEWEVMYAMQRYEPTEKDSGLRMMSKHKPSGKIYEEKIRVIRSNSMNGKEEHFEYFDKVEVAV